MKTFQTDPAMQWLKFTMPSLERTWGRSPALLTNVGGSLPNDVFTYLLGLPTIWIPHSYPACAQHAPDEHLLAPLARQGLAIMAGLFCDLDTRDIIGDERGPS